MCTVSIAFPLFCPAAAYELNPHLLYIDMGRIPSQIPPE
jgi:hypothetical protein